MSLENNGDLKVWRLPRTHLDKTIALHKDERKHQMQAIDYSWKHLILYVRQCWSAADESHLHFQ